MILLLIILSILTLIFMLIDAVYSIYTSYKHNNIAKDLKNLINEGQKMNESKNKLISKLKDKYNIKF